MRSTGLEPFPESEWGGDAPMASISQRLDQKQAAADFENSVETASVVASCGADEKALNLNLFGRGSLFRPNPERRWRDLVDTTAAALCGDHGEEP
jgi:hypothetical protein